MNGVSSAKKKLSSVDNWSSTKAGFRRARFVSPRASGRPISGRCDSEHGNAFSSLPEYLIENLLLK
jgi:hypothetical protein